MCYMAQHVTHWPSFLRQIHALETSWNTIKVSYPREDAVPFLPFPIPQFISMLTDAVMAATISVPGKDGLPASTFLDVGCGIGTKVRLAEAMFGVRGFGIDIVPSFVAEARQSGVSSAVIDAFDFSEYGQFDIIFANRPSTLQDDLEKLICGSMSRGAVLMAANWRHDPAEFGLEGVALEYGRPVCGVWRRPL